MKPEDIKRGDIVTYGNGKRNYVNKPSKYIEWFTGDFRSIKYKELYVVKIQRYVKCLWFYRLKTIYKKK